MVAQCEEGRGGGVGGEVRLVCGGPGEEAVEGALKGQKWSMAAVMVSHPLIFNDVRCSELRR